MIIFRAIRFGWHLLVHGHKKHLCHEIYSQLGSMFCYPLWLALRKKPKGLQGVTIETKHLLAVTSPDHTNPHGTAENTRHSYSFAVWAAYTARKFLDIGCAHGGLVEDMLALGCQAIGLEGSDYNRKHKRESWARLDGKGLHTVDVEKPFSIKLNNAQWKADLITCWQVIEHLTHEGVAIALANMRQHMHDKTILLISTANNSDLKNGVELHQTQWSKLQWLRAFHKAGLCSTENPFPRWTMYRNSPDGLDFALMKRTTADDLAKV